jgi:Fic family protein
MSATATTSMTSKYTQLLPFSAWAVLVVDTGAFERQKADIDALASKDPDLLRKARGIAKRTAAIDTGAIEGLYQFDRGKTITFAAQIGFWQAAYEKEEAKAKALIESQLAAYDEIIDFATKAVPIAEAWIRGLHATLCAAQGTYEVQTDVGPQTHQLPLGQYKLQPNTVQLPNGNFREYAPVDATPTEMEKPVSELRGDEFARAHPILQAAYAHYGLVWIHPFADGNGRVARALGSVFTYRAASIPMFILVEHRDIYFSSLLAADEGNRQPFVTFVQARCLDAFGLIRQTLRSAQLPDAVDAQKRVEMLYLTTGGYMHTDVDDAAVRLFDAIVTKAQERTNEYVIKNALRISLNPNHQEAPTAISEGYRGVLGKQRIALHISFSSLPPAQATATLQVWVIVPRDSGPDSSLRVMCSHEGIDSLELPMRDLHPTLTMVAELRITIFMDSLFAVGMDLLASAGRAQLQSQGY